MSDTATPSSAVSSVLQSMKSAIGQFCLSLILYGMMKPIASASIDADRLAVQGSFTILVVGAFAALLR